MKEVIQFDYHNVLFAYLSNEHKLDITSVRSHVTDRIVNFYTSFLQHKSGAVGLEAVKIIHALQDRLETQMKDTICTKSIYYWFHLYRRIAPVATFENESDNTVLLYRSILENAFVKYGNRKTNKELIFSTLKRKIDIKDIANGWYLEALKFFRIADKTPSKGDGIYFGEFGDKEFIEIHSLERLAYEYWRTTVCLRRINKGGTLFIDEGNYHVKNDHQVELLMKSYDTRGGGWDDLSGSDGIMLTPEKETEGIMPVPKYNVEQLSLKEFPIHNFFSLNLAEDILQRFKPNFTWIMFDFDYYYVTHYFYKESFQKKFGYSLEGFIYFMYLLIYREFRFCRINSNFAGIELIKRAYRHINKIDVLAEELMSYFSENIIASIKEYTLTKEEIILIIKDLTLPEDTSTISLKTLGPRFLFLPAIHHDYFIDYSAILHILMTKTHFLKIDKSEKGFLFEDTVIQRLKSTGHNLWEFKKKLKHFDGTLKEIDVSFVYKNVLFIGELKSNKQSLNFIEGNVKELEYRKGKILKALKQVDEKAVWLIKHNAGTNYCIPKEVNIIVPFVISPFIEYIWSFSEELWITETIPRVCVPSECCCLCNEEVVSSIIHKPYSRFIV